MISSNNLTPRPSKDCVAFNCPIGAARETLRQLRKEFSMLMDLTAIDHGVEASPRFEVIWHLFNRETREYLRLASFCAPSPEPAAPSVADLWPAANWHERECYDFFGIRFEGHPDLRRILMWEGYPYHPLRKDFPISGLPAPLPAGADDVAEATGAGVESAPMAGGPFAAPQNPTMSRREPRGGDQSWRENRGKI
jgi:NADH-quinone oxidoreductase subunit C